MSYLNASLPQRLRAVLSILLLACAATAAPALAEPLVHAAISQIPAQVASATALGRMAAKPSMTIDFVLPLRNQAQLQDQLARIYDPKDPLHGHYLTPQQFADAYGPSTADVNAVAAFAKSKGLTLVSVSGNKTLVKVAGASSAVEAAFGVHLNSYQAASGRVFFAPDREPVFPASVASRIVGLAGLDNAKVRRSYSRRSPIRPALTDLPGLIQPLGKARPNDFFGSGPGGFLAPSDIASIYTIPVVSSPGAGQTLAVFELDGYTPSDIAGYESGFFSGLPSVPLQNVLVDGYNGAAGGGAGEVTLDIEVMIALCPHASKIIVYEANNDNVSSDDEYAKIASDNLASCISTSWGSPEFGTTPDSDATSENQSFTQMAMQGQSMFDAAGDAGAYDDTQTLSVDDPGSQPFITAVGGTFLNDTSAFAYVSESAWGDAQDTGNGRPLGNGSGGGISMLWPIPSYQSGFINASNKGSTSARNVPDVSIFGDFDESFYSTFFQGGFDGSNGTSAAAPIWAAYIALVNQGRASHGLGRIGFINPIVYGLAKNATTYANDFHDVNDGTTNLFYPAVTGYDLATGLGSPKGTALYNDLVAYGTTGTVTLAGFAGSPTSVAPGGGFSLAAVLSGNAPTGGASVALTLNGATQSPIVVAAGQTTGTVNYTAGASAGTDTFVASYGGVSKTVVITITASSVPTITGFSPASGPVGTSVTITGTNFTGATAVKFNGTAATTVTVVSATSITATVPTGATTGTITVTTPGGTATSTTAFTVTTVTLNSLTVAPATVPQNTNFTITATLTGAAPTGGASVALTQNGAAQSPIVITAGQASGSVTYGSGAASGTFTYSATYNGVTKTATVTIVAPPTITSFAPTSGPVGTSVTITGTNFTGATAVKFNGTAATAFTVASATSITATVPTGATTGTIAVTTQGGTATSTAAFTVTTQTAPGIATLTFSNYTITGGNAVLATLTLTAAPQTDTVVTLTPQGSCTIPATVTVRAGATATTFNVQTAIVPAKAGAYVIATLNGKSVKTGMTLLPPQVQTLLLSPNMVIGGTPVTGVVLLTVPAPSGGIVVTLTSANPSVVSVPASVTVAAGSYTATFTATTNAVASVTKVTVDSTTTNLVGAATLTVLP